MSSAELSAPSSPAHGGGDTPEVSPPASAGFAMRLQVPAESGSLSLIRHAVGGIAVALGDDPAAVADIRLALTEVCSTAIRRAAGRGTIELRCDATHGALRVVVRDTAPADGGAEGGGVLRTGDGVPLPLVAALTETVELRHATDGPGTEVTLTFALARMQR